MSQPMGVGYVPQPPPQKPSNGLAVGGFIVALVGFLLSLIPFVGTVSWVISPVGLVLSLVGTVAAGRRQGSGRGLGIAGVVLGVLGLIFCIIYTATFFNAVDEGVQNFDAQSTAVRDVTYRVETENDSDISAFYSQSQNGDLGSASVSGVASPWTVDARVSGFGGPTLSASLSPDLEDMDSSDTITCIISENGVELTRNSATGPMASVSCTG